MGDDPTTKAASGAVISVTLMNFTEETIASAPNPTAAIGGATTTFYSSHAAFVDNFGAIFTILSCGIAGY